MKINLYGATEKTIENLNTAKLILCNQQMLTSEMCIRIGQVVTDALALLKEQETEIRQLKLALDIAKGTCEGIAVTQKEDNELK